MLHTKIDNTSALAWINRLYARADEADGCESNRLEWLERYAGYQQRNRIVVKAAYITSADNVLADALSRPLTHAHVFDEYVTQRARGGHGVRRIRITAGWTPAG